MKSGKILVLVLLLLVCVSGCGAAERAQPEQSSVDFEHELMKTDWQFNTMGYSGTVRFKEETGLISFSNGQSRTFSYTVHDVSEDHKEAELTLSDTGISALDGKTVDARFHGTVLYLAYSGVSVALSPVK